ncbi:MAG: leucyl aminopeptidase [Synergistaceae bacterium]|nr:leucyl aminopeptidase [Synergistaceae bacterium]
MNIFAKNETNQKFAAHGFLLDKNLILPSQLDNALATKLKTIFLAEQFNGLEDEFLTVPTEDGLFVFAGLGEKRENSDTDVLRIAAYKVARFVAESGRNNLELFVPCLDDTSSIAVVEGVALANYRFNKYKSEPKDNKEKFTELENVVIYGIDESIIPYALASVEAQNFARNIANEPGNSIHPEELAQIAQDLAQEYNLKCEIWDENRIIKENLGAFYAVGKGSASQPRLIHLTYEPSSYKKHLALVGKGITFDTGGLDLKPSGYMLTMKGDKTGACVVLGVIKSIAEMKLPVKVSLFIAAAENMPGADSYHPDDILTARNGKTIEVNNTDAEGRLTLADALCLACEQKPDLVIDIATLTGACAVALGSTTSGLFSNNGKLAEQILSASVKTGESFWRLPMTDKHLKKQLESKFADLSNCGERYGGAITAALFLQEFVTEGTPWAHLDIAGADFVKSPYDYYTCGATAFGARTIFALANELAK